jgi:hypothetical protein
MEFQPECGDRFVSNQKSGAGAATGWFGELPFSQSIFGLH